MEEDVDQKQNRREHPRFKAKLLGRYMLPDCRESKCSVIDVSLGGIALAAPERGAVGERVVVYIGQIGRIEGTIVRHLPDGFAVRLAGTARVVESIAERLEELQAKGKLSSSVDRRQEPMLTVEDEPAQSDK